MTTTSPAAAAAADSAKREVALWLARHPFSVGAPKVPVRRVLPAKKKLAGNHDDDDDDDDDDAHGGEGKRKIKALDSIELKSQVRERDGNGMHSVKLTQHAGGARWQTTFNSCSASL
jgi:hypothetical protein